MTRREKKPTQHQDKDNVKEREDRVDIAGSESGAEVFLPSGQFSLGKYRHSSSPSVNQASRGPRGVDKADRSNDIA